MIHTIIYHGRYSSNFERLQTRKDRLNDFTRLDTEGYEQPLDVPAENVDGIVFGYMQDRMEELDEEPIFLVVRVNNTVLANPLKLNPELHTDGKGFGPVASQFGDGSAARLLRDIIEANPEQRGPSLHAAASCGASVRTA